MKLLSLQTWRPRHLLGAWGVYWTGLAAVTLGRPILAVLRLTNDPDSHGSASASMDNGVVNVEVIDRATTVWTGGASLLEIGLWVVGPPLVVWLAWLLLRPRRQDMGAGATAAPARDLASEPARPGLPGSAPDYIRAERRERASERWPDEKH